MKEGLGLSMALVVPAAQQIFVYIGSHQENGRVKQDGLSRSETQTVMGDQSSLSELGSDARQMSRLVAPG